MKKTSKKTPKARAKSSTKVKDLKAKKNPKGGQFYGSGVYKNQAR